MHLKKLMLIKRIDIKAMGDRNILEDIIDCAKRQREPSYSDINNAFPSEFISEDKLENTLDILQDAGIEPMDRNKIAIEEKEDLEKQEEYEKAEDLVQIYFQSMGNIPVLSRDEETGLAMRIKEENDIIKRIVTMLPLYKRLMKELNRRAQEDDFNTSEKKTDMAIRKTLEILDKLMPDMYSQIESVVGIKLDELKKKYDRIIKARKLIFEVKDKLITHNLRLVVNVAKHYIGRGLSLLDLIQEGNIGLIRAIDKFDYKKGFKLSTYATWWIRQAITRALIDQTKTIRIPVHMVGFYNRVNNASKELTRKLGREPCTEEIAQNLRVPRRKIEDILTAIQDPITLHTLIGDEESTFEDFIGDNGSSPYADVERNKLSEQIIEILHTLSPKEEEVIKMRFGIGVDRDYTLKEIGKQLSITRERVRQIELKALAKLKHPKRLMVLRQLNPVY